MKKLFTIISVCLTLSGCSFLDVNPKGETFDEDMFTSGEGYEDALYGVYAELSSDEYLFGGYYFWLPEIMGGNSTAIGDYKLGNMALLDWDTAGPISVRKSVWGNSYEVINHLNNIIAHAEEGGEDEFTYSKIYKGEALALRALVHFELVNFFASPYWSASSYKEEGIPYVTTYSFTITPFSSVDEVFGYILADLKEAESIMGEDESFIEELGSRDNSASGFTDARITHMNLYAVQALIARTYWVMGDLENAATYAKKVISSGKFGMRPLQSFVQPDNGTLDLYETIFGLYVGAATSSYQTRNVTKYHLSGTSTTSSFTLASDWASLYDDGSSTSGTDYRLSAWFDDSELTLTKLVNKIYYNSSSSSYTGNSIIGANVIRIPEMYYIVAEYYLENGDATTAAEYLDPVLTSRGLDDIATQGVTLDMDRLYTERRKEFYGDGMIWHEMKHRQTNLTVTSGTTYDGTSPATWTIPIPDEEYEAREDIS
ncbi:MAG: RagB/SusD family nutrient uptake outer membrane protein [Bacteroidales bacterium]|nr:RagB/SusD family nutrient uptake outer membrane protein [Bacteroidales bacterium]